MTPFQNPFKTRPTAALLTLSAAAAIFALSLTFAPAARVQAQDAAPTPTVEPTLEPPPNCPAFADEPTDVRTGYYMGEGLAYLNANQLGGADLAFTCIIRVVDGDYFAAYLARAEVRQQQRDYRRAIADYNAALQRSANSTAALNNRGIAYTILGEYDEAAADFDRVLAADTDNLSAVNNRAVLYAIAGDYAGAIALLDEAIDGSGIEAQLAEARRVDRPADAEPLQIDPLAARLYAMRGIIESEQSLASFRSYLDLSNESGRYADERIQTAAGSLESRATFELRLDDGSWMLRSSFTASN